jgi:hypothetical protein
MEHLGTRPLHTGKYVHHPKGTLSFEEDYYYSGKSYPSHDPDAGLENQRMSIRYSYDLEKAGKDPWQCRVSIGPEEGEEYSLKEAEAILTKWGLERYPSDDPGTKANE